VILFSTPRREGVAVLVVLPEGGRLVIRYADDASEVDITPIAADLLVSFLLWGDGIVPDGEHDGVHPGNVHLGDVELHGGELSQVRFATIDLHSGTVGEVPADRLLPLLGSALATAVEEGAGGETPAPQ
jgi:hypothetical protein